MTAFLSTYTNKVDRKKRVSVPASFRAVIAESDTGKLIAYPSLRDPAIEAMSRDVLNRISRRRMDQSLEQADFDQILLGSGDSDLDTMMSIANDLPFDREGRVVIPSDFAEHAGISDEAVFVGRGNRFQIWAPERFRDHQDRALAALRRRIGNGAAA